MKCIYWNTKNIDNIDRILGLAQDEGPDLLFLSETKNNLIEENQSALNNIGYEYYPNPGCERVIIIKKNDIESELGLQTRYYTAIKIINIQTYIISVHLPSLLYHNIDSLKSNIRNFRENIDLYIGNSLDERILIIGDFNVNPFEKPMIDYDGFLATNSIKSRKEITNLGEIKSLYYNPTWQLYSRIYFPGTKYFKRPFGTSYDILEFHYLDQVVLSQKLNNDIKWNRIDVIENTRNFSFFDSVNNIIEGSDHLPILFEFIIN